MQSVDALLLGFLCLAIAVSVFFRRHRAVRGLALLLFVGMIWGALFELYAFAPRLAMSQHQRSGKQWSAEVSEGAAVVTEVSRPWYPYIFVSSVGLAVLALLPMKAVRGGG